MHHPRVTNYAGTAYLPAQQITKPRSRPSAGRDGFLDPIERGTATPPLHPGCLGPRTRVAPRDRGRHPRRDQAPRPGSGTPAQPNTPAPESDTAGISERLGRVEGKLDALIAMVAAGRGTQ